MYVATAHLLLTRTQYQGPTERLGDVLKLCAQEEKEASEHMQLSLSQWPCKEHIPNHLPLVLTYAGGPWTTQAWIVRPTYKRTVFNPASSVSAGFPSANSTNPRWRRFSRIPSCGFLTAVSQQQILNPDEKDCFHLWLVESTVMRSAHYKVKIYKCGFSTVVVRISCFKFFGAKWGVNSLLNFLVIKP